MNNENLKKALELQKQIDELENFLEFICDLGLKGETTVKKWETIFKYKSWRKEEKTFKFNERLTFNILLQVEKELDDLKKQFEYL